MNDSDPKNKKIRTESGVLIPATYKTDFYSQWRKMHQIDFQNKDDSNDEATKSKSIHDVNKILGSGRSKNVNVDCFWFPMTRIFLVKYRKVQMVSKQTPKDKRKFKPGKLYKTELRPKEDIAKERQKKSLQMARQKHRQEVNEKNRKSAKKDKPKKR